MLGETTVVVGLGILGQLVTQYLASPARADVIAIDTVGKRRDLAFANGATHAICRPVDEAREDVARDHRRPMADVVFDITGHPAVLAPRASCCAS